MNSSADLQRRKPKDTSGVNAAALAEAGGVLKEVYLHPGETFASLAPVNITMILGSCVGLCLHDPKLSIGGATHYMLPSMAGEGKPSSRYGDVAIRTLIDKLLELGSCKRDLQVKVFGGACMFQNFRNGGGELIGDRNIRMALDMLGKEGIPILARDTGGEAGRKVKMRSDTGDTFLKFVGK